VEDLIMSGFAPKMSRRARAAHRALDAPRPAPPTRAVRESIATSTNVDAEGFEAPRGRGRPPLPEARIEVKLRLLPEVLVAVDAAAKGAGVSRHALLERLIRKGLRIREPK
jgi:hypothetical protein